MPTNNRYEVTVTLPSDREIRFTRLFDWPARLLFEAWTTPEHLRHWYGCPGSRLTYCEIDLRVGGTWRLNMHQPDGSDHPFHGVYREIDAPGRLVYTECYDKPEIGSPEWLTTVSFEEVDGKTRMTHLLRHRSKEVRDAHLQSGMEKGVTIMLNQLDDHVAAMAASTGASR